MRDDSHKWPAFASSPVAIAFGSCQLTPVLPERQMLMSGPSVFAQVTEPLVGWPDVAPQAAYALGLRRDCVLVVNGAEVQVGWDHAAGVAVSDATDAFAVFDLTGPDALDLLRHGAELSYGQSSKSVARRLFGLDVLLYRVEAPLAGYRIHVAAALRDALVSQLCAAASGADGNSA